MKLHKLLSIVFLTLLFSSSLHAELEVFSFPMTQMSVIKGSQYYPAMDKESVIEVNVADRGKLYVIGEGKYKLLEVNGGSWRMNTSGALALDGNHEEGVVINQPTGVISIKVDDSVIMFKVPKSTTNFNNTYNRLLAYLKQIGKFKGAQGTQASSSAQTSSQAASNGPTNPPASLKGVNLDLAKMCISPFGIKPVNNKKYSINDINAAAKSVWGWDLQLDYKSKTAGYKWPSLNGMVFLGNPIYRIYASDYNGGIFLSDFSCELIVPDSYGAIRKVNKDITSYFKSRGWTQAMADNPDRLIFYKNNVIVECYNMPSDMFKGKVEYTINAQSFPNEAVVRERIQNGLG